LVIRKVGSGPLARQQALGEGGDEDHRHVEARQDILDRVDARRAVGQLDVGEHQSGRLVQHRLQRLAARGGDVDDAVAQFLDQRLDVGGDDGLVLDDQDVGGQILVDLLLRLRDQRLGFGKVGVQNLRRLEGVKPSSAVSRKAWRERGAIRSSLCAASSVLGSNGSASLFSSCAPVEPQMAWNTR
jgi:hypothetical protein